MVRRHVVGGRLAGLEDPHGRRRIDDRVSGVNDSNAPGHDSSCGGRGKSHTDSYALPFAAIPVRCRSIDGSIPPILRTSVGRPRDRGRAQRSHQGRRIHVSLRFDDGRQQAPPGAWAAKRRQRRMKRVEHDLSGRAVGQPCRRRGAVAPTAPRTQRSDAARLRAGALARRSVHARERRTGVRSPCNASKCNDEVTGWLRRKRLDERSVPPAAPWRSGLPSSTGFPSSGSIGSRLRQATVAVFFPRTGT